MSAQLSPKKKTMKEKRAEFSAFVSDVSVLTENRNNCLPLLRHKDLQIGCYAKNYDGEFVLSLNVSEVWHEKKSEQVFLWNSFVQKHVPNDLKFFYERTWTTLQQAFQNGDETFDFTFSSRKDLLEFVRFLFKFQESRPLQHPRP